MNLKHTPIKIETCEGLLKIVHFLDAEYMSIQCAETFQIHSNFIRNNIPKNMYIKCGIKWSDSLNENAWVKVINSKLGDDGKKFIQQHLMKLT
jgi:hypothetical protein